MKVEIAKEFEIACSHTLNWHPGKCANPHGHNYRIIIYLQGELTENGVIEDFGDIKKLFKEKVDAKYDHANLNNLIFNPTAENLAIKFLKILSSEHPKIVWV